VDRWCGERQLPRGATVSIETIWKLSAPWYGNRVDYAWSPRTPEETERLLSGVGLTGDFWRVR
jgi:hypothetical protein